MNNLPIDSCPINISDEDIFEAMKEIRGYLDITPGDFKEIYLKMHLVMLTAVSLKIIY